MNRIILWTRLHPKISLWIGFIFVSIFYGQDNILGVLVEWPARAYFLYFIYIVIKWLFGSQGIGEKESGDSNELWHTSGAQGKVGKMRRGMRRARRMRR